MQENRAQEEEEEEEEEQLHAQAIAELLPHMINHEHVPLLLQALQELQIDERVPDLVTAEQLTALLLQFQPPQALNEPPPPKAVTPPATTVQPNDTSLISNLDRTVYFLFASTDKEVRVGISLRAAMQSALVHSILGDDFDSMEEVEIPLLEVKHSIGLKICEFFKRHEFDPYTFATRPLPSRRGLKMSDVCANAWDCEFISNVANAGMLYDVILAANYLDAPSLLDLGIVKLSMDLQNCANMDEVNQFLGLEHEGKLTVEESARVKRENAWFFQMKPLSAFIVAPPASPDENGA